MLLGLHFNENVSYKDKEDIGVSLANLIGKRTRVFESRNLDEYIATLKGYRPAGKDNYVLINTHYDFSNQLSLGNWRAFDLTMAQKGGIVFGEAPQREAYTYQQEIRLDYPDHLVTTAQFYEERANYLKKSAPGYIGRADTDPHTLILGFSPSWPKLSVYAEALLAGLPDDWWQGVGYYNRRNKDSLSVEEAYKRVIDRFYFASYVVVSDTAEDVLTSLNIPFQRAPKVEARTLPEAQKYGKELRRISRIDAERVVE